MHIKAMGEQCKVFVMKANVKCKAKIYNIQNLGFQTTKFGWWCASPLSPFQKRGSLPLFQDAPLW